MAKHQEKSDVDIAQMNSLREIGIGAPHIFGYFANQSGELRKLVMEGKTNTNMLKEKGMNIVLMLWLHYNVCDCCEALTL